LFVYEYLLLNTNNIINYLILYVNKGYNLPVMNKIKTKIKMLVISRGMTLKNLAQRLSELTGENYSYNSLLGKLNRESLSLKEAEIIAGILDYRLEFADNTR